MEITETYVYNYYDDNKRTFFLVFNFPFEIVCVNLESTLNFVRFFLHEICMLIYAEFIGRKT